MSSFKDKLDRSQPVRVAVANLLEQAILEGSLRPGDEVPQLKLAECLGLSQGSVREGLLELEHRGLIVANGRTRSVVKLSEDDLAHIYDLRAILEPRACQLAAQIWSQEMSRKLQTCVERMEAGTKKGDYHEHLQADIEFHRTIWSHQPNRYLERALLRLCMPLWSYDLVQRTHECVLDVDNSLRQHRLIIETLRTRDGVKTERIVRRLVERFFRQDLRDYARVERLSREHERLGQLPWCSPPQILSHLQTSLGRADRGSEHPDY